MELQYRQRMSDTFSVRIDELCWRLLEQWKAIGLVALCTMALFLGLLHFRYANDSHQENQVKNHASLITEQQIIESLPENKRSVVASAYRFWKQREYLSYYIDNAAIMRIDPNHAKRLRVSWAINASENQINALTNAYMVEVQSEQCRKALLDSSGIELSSEQANDLIFITSQDKTNQAVVCFDIFLTDDMDDVAFQEELKRQIDNMYTRLQTEIGEHQIKNYQSEISTVSDDRLLSKQLTILNNFANANNQINTFNNTFSSDQKDAFAKLQEKNNRKEIVEQTPEAPRALSARNALVGLMLGFILYLITYYLYLVLSGKIISNHLIEEMHIRSFGEWYDWDSRGKPLLHDGFIWKRHHKNNLDREKTLERTKRKLENACTCRSVNTLMMAMTADCSEAQKAFIQNIVDYFGPINKNAISVEIDKINDIDDSAFLNTESVLLIIVDSSTTYKDLECILNLCDDYHKQIIGSLYLG